MWSRTNTLKITLELVRNAGSDLLPRDGKRIRAPSPPKAPRISAGERSSDGFCSTFSTRRGVGAAVSARMEFVKGPAHSTRPYIRGWRGWWCPGNRGDRPARVLASPGGQYRTCPFWNKGCWALGSERTGIPWGCSLSQPPPGQSDPEQSPPLG